MSLRLLYFLHTMINHLHQTQKTLQLKAYQIGNNMEMQMIVIQQYNCLRMIYVKNDLNAVSCFKITREAQLMLVLCDILVAARATVVTFIIFYKKT